MEKFKIRKVDGSYRFTVDERKRIANELREFDPTAVETFTLLIERMCCDVMMFLSSNDDQFQQRGRTARRKELEQTLSELRESIKTLQRLQRDNPPLFQPWTIEDVWRNGKPGIKLEIQLRKQWMGNAHNELYEASTAISEIQKIIDQLKNELAHLSNARGPGGGITQELSDHTAQYFKKYLGTPTASLKGPFVQILDTLFSAIGKKHSRPDILARKSLK